MKKKDLELGGIYAGKHAHPMLVLSTRIWMQDRYSHGWKVYPRRITAPQRGSVWNEMRGILVVEGGTVEELRAFAKDYPGLHRFEKWQKGDPESDKEAHDLVSWVESVARGRGLRVSVADYRRWVGTAEEAAAKVAEEKRRREQEREQAESKAKPHCERALRAEEHARRLLGQAEEWGYGRWDYTWVVVGDAAVSVPVKVKLSVEELERLVEMAERGPDPRRGDATEAWLVRARDEQVSDSSGWHAVDGMLDDYRLRADEGRRLGAE